MPIFFETEKLRIIKFTENHITPVYIAWLNDKEVVKYSELRHIVHTHESCYQYFKSFQDTPNFFGAIEVFDDGIWKHIGNVNSYVNEKNKIADVGILIGEKTMWGNGYGFIAWNGMCNYLLSKRQMRKVTGGAMSSNKSMLKIMQRVGMSEDGTRIRQYVCDGNEVDVCHYALFSEASSA